MNQIQNVEITLTLKLPDAKNPSALLAKVEEALRLNQFPPSMGNLKGFTRHVTNREVNGDTLTVDARVGTDHAKPTVMNLGGVVAAVSATAMMASIFSEPDNISVQSALIIADPNSRRAAALMTLQKGTDVPTTDDNGKVSIPLPRQQVAFTTMDTPDDQIVQETWSESGKAFLEKAWAYLEAGCQTSN